MAIDYDAFRRELEDFARRACPPEIRAVVAAGQKVTKREYQRWQQILNEQGWGRADLGGRWYWQTIAKVVRDSRSKKPRR